MPRRPSPAESLAARFKKRRSVSRPIASDTWTYTDRSGQEQAVKLQIGRPEPIPGDKQRDWFCPVFVEGWTPHVVPAIGVGPFDALMNALVVVRSFREHIADMHITRRATDRTRRR
jgi:hypothetical protein